MLSEHFGEDKTKFIIFLQNIDQKQDRDISNKDVKIKQYSKKTYLGCVLNECLTGESRTMKVCTKIASKIKFTINSYNIPMFEYYCFFSLKIKNINFILK